MRTSGNWDVAAEAFESLAAETDPQRALAATALTEGRGFIRNQASELSNVDIGVEFTQLITAQRGYQINARALSIAETTVKIHVQHILRKLGLSSRVQAAVYASDRQR